MGPLSIWRCHLTNIGIPIIKIRQSPDHFIFIIEIPICEKAVLILRQGRVLIQVSHIHNNSDGPDLKTQLNLHQQNGLIYHYGGTCRHLGVSSSLIQVVFCHLLRAKLLPQPMLIYHLTDIKEHISITFIQERNTSATVVCQMSICIWTCLLQKAALT